MGAAFLFLFLPQSVPNSISIQFYDENQQPVGEPRTLAPLAPVLVDSVEVTYFSVSITWFTNNPNVDIVEWGINVKVYYFTGEFPSVTEHVVFDNLCWNNGADTLEGTSTTSLYAIDAYAELGVPENTYFYMNFYGFVKFGELGLGWTSNIDIAPVEVTCYHSEYTYEAILNIGV